jgi:3-phenylpropionate/trans-cinnamate dioxygenase ferredoxin reductase subunit
VGGSNLTREEDSVSYQNVIVGGGLAGGMIAQEYREQGGDGSIVIIASEPHHPYHRPPLTKDFLRGEKPASDGDMHPPAWWRQNDIEVRTATTATAIDPEGHTVTLADGETVAYERLALATGATPRTIPGTSSIRTIEDSTRVASVLDAGEGHLGVIGGGFIGVEAAASARMKGLEVTMAVPEAVVWEHLFGPEVGRYFQDQLESHGVTVLTGTKELPERAYNLVLAGIGVNPNIDLARAAGLATGSGVLVDEHLSAGDDIWAVGDIAEYQSVVHGKRIRIEHWDVALNQGAYVGRMWAGKESGPYDVVPYFFSDIGDWTWFEYVGPGKGEVEIRGSMAEDDFVAYYTDADGAVTACLGVNRSDDVNAAKELITKRQPPPAA